jgi:hypothetical protein
MNVSELANEYYAKILLPASRALLQKVANDDLLTVDAVSYGFIASHFIDYIWEVKKKEVPKIKRHEVVEDIDRILFDCEGKRFKLGLLRFICSVNNSVKHVHLAKNAHNICICDYHGIINLKALQERSGKLWFVTDINEFDYGRIVLRQVADAFSIEIDSDSEDSENVVLRIYSGDWESGIGYEDDPYDPNDPSTAIESMIWQCNPICSDCGFGESECECSTYKFSDDITEFRPEIRTIDFDKIMGQISGAYKRD